MERQRSRGSPGRSGRLLGFGLRPGHILHVAEVDSLLFGHALLIQAVALLRANGATAVVVCSIDAATGEVRERMPATPEATPFRLLLDC